MMQQRGRDEAGSRRVNMAITLGMLAKSKKALRHDKLQAILRPRHGDIEQPALLFDFRGGAGTEVGGDAAVHGVENEDPFPFLSLGGMDRGQDQIILREPARRPDR